MLDENVISSKIIYDGKVVKLVVNEIELPNGKFSTREIVETKDSVGIIALTKNNEVILVKQFRSALGKIIYEIPAGCIDEGESPLETARRELLEETGYGNGDFKLINGFYSSPGTNKATHYLFFATDVEVVNSQLTLDEDEFLEMEVCSLDTFDHLVATNQICDLKTSYAHIYLKSLK